MNLYGWCFLGLSWAFIIGLLVFCFGKLFVEQSRPDKRREGDVIGKTDDEDKPQGEEQG